MKPFIHLPLSGSWPADKVQDILIACETAAAGTVTIGQCLACPRSCSYKIAADHPVDLYLAIKEGRKKVEHRTCNKHWLIRLTGHRRVPVPVDVVRKAMSDPACNSIDVTKFLRTRRAYLTRGYPKNLKPRLEADIAKLTWTRDGFLDLQLENVREVL